jgi:hypothetical protein
MIVRKHSKIVTENADFFISEVILDIIIAMMSGCMKGFKAASCLL